MVWEWQNLSRLFYKNGKLEGVQEEWHESGYILIRNNCKNGKKDGVQEIINIVDRRIAQTFYKDEKSNHKKELGNVILLQHHH